MEYEMSMRQKVEADVARLRKLLDDTNVTRMHLESEIESLKEELINLKKNHEAVRDAFPLTSLHRITPLTWLRKSLPDHFPSFNRMFLNCVPRSPRAASMWMLTLLKDRTWPGSWRR